MSWLWCLSLDIRKVKVHMNQVAQSEFISVSRAIIPLPPQWDAGPSQGLPPSPLKNLIRFPWQSASAYLSWVERSTVRVECLDGKINTMTNRGLGPRPLEPESSALTIQPACLAHPGCRNWWTCVFFLLAESKRKLRNQYVSSYDFTMIQSCSCVRAFIVHVFYTRALSLSEILPASFTTHLKSSFCFHFYFSWARSARITNHIACPR